MRILAMKAEYIASRIHQMTGQMIQENGVPLADSFYLDAVEQTIKSALFELGE